MKTTPRFASAACEAAAGWIAERPSLELPIAV